MPRTLKSCQRDQAGKLEKQGNSGGWSVQRARFENRDRVEDCPGKPGSVAPSCTDCGIVATREANGMAPNVAGSRAALCVSPFAAHADASSVPIPKCGTTTLDRQDATQALKRWQTGWTPCVGKPSRRWEGRRASGTGASQGRDAMRQEPALRRSKPSGSPRSMR